MAPESTGKPVLQTGSFFLLRKRGGSVGEFVDFEAVGAGAAGGVEDNDCPVAGMEFEGVGENDSGTFFGFCGECDWH